MRNEAPRRLPRKLATVAAAAVVGVAGCSEAPTPTPTASSIRTDTPTPSARPSAAPSQEFYATYLEEFCAQGNKPIDIYVWNRNQITPATTYKDANDQECREKGTPVNIVVSDQDVQTGDVVNGRRVIRYVK